MYRKKNFISLGMSLVLAAGITVTPVTAADFTDGTVPEFNSDDATEFDAQQETADNAEFASDTEDNISDKAGSNEADSDEEVFAEAVIPDENGAVDNRQLLEKYLNDILYGQDPDTQPAASLGEDVLNGQQQTLYEELKSKISAVASKGGSTRFKVSSDLGLTWQTTASGNALKREVAAHLNELDISKIIDCLADGYEQLHAFYKKNEENSHGKNNGQNHCAGKGKRICLPGFRNLWWSCKHMGLR